MRKTRIMFGLGIAFLIGATIAGIWAYLHPYHCYDGTVELSPEQYQAVTAIAPRDTIDVIMLNENGLYTTRVKITVNKGIPYLANIEKRLGWDDIFFSEALLPIILSIIGLGFIGFSGFEEEHKRSNK